jgi:outer membrane protein TolC
MILLCRIVEGLKGNRAGYLALFRSLIVVILQAIYCPTQAWPQTLEFDRVLSDALNNAYDLQIAAAKVDLKTIRVDEARAVYYPTLAMRLGSEY